MEFAKHLMDIVLIFIGLAPIILQIGSAIAHKSHNQKIKNLLERATIIVNALEQDDYIEYAVKFMNAVNGG